jgi:hypothetical protein
MQQEILEDIPLTIDSEQIILTEVPVQIVDETNDELREAERDLADLRDIMRMFQRDILRQGDMVTTVLLLSSRAVNHVMAAGRTILDISRRVAQQPTSVLIVAPAVVGAVAGGPLGFAAGSTMTAAAVGAASGAAAGAGAGLGFRNWLFGR